MGVSWWLALLALSGCLALECPPTCRCEADDLLRFYCSGSGTAVRARDDGYMEVECEKDIPLNCSTLPPLPVGDASPLQRLEVTRCKLSPSLSLAGCAVRSRGSGARAISLQGALGPLSAENVAGMEEVESLFIMFAPGVQSSVPTAAMRALPGLRRVRVLGGAAAALRADMFARAPPLALLELALGGLAELPAGAFRGLARLAVLGLWGNRIANVSVDAFAGLRSLEDVRLNSNPIPALPEGVFAECPRLRRACLERVRLERLPRGALAGLPRLEELKLRSDVKLTLDPKALSDLPSLTSLSITFSKISSLPADLLDNSPNVVNLTLNDNDISELPERVFGSLRALRRLDLSGNQIRAVTRDMFRNLTSLVEINLDRNRIKELPDQLFSGLSHLWTVSVNNNQLESISFFSFVGAESLRSLSLSHNRLSWGGDEMEASSPFHMLHNLERLSLSYNNISYVYSDWRFVLRALTALDLSHNAFRALSLSEVQFLSRVSGGQLSVDFTHNHIATVQPRAPWAAPPAPRAALRLLVDHNPFACDCRLYDFLLEIREDSKYSVHTASCASPPPMGGTPLLSLDLEEVTCQVPDVACDCLVRPAKERVECDCLSPEEVPDISASGYGSMSLRLRSAPADLRALPAAVSELNLTGLRLRTAPALPAGLRALDLSRNELARVPRELFARPHLDLYLAHNPLACGCFAGDQLELLRNHSRRVRDFALVTCGGRPAALQAPGAQCDGLRAWGAGAGAAAALLLAAGALAGARAGRARLQVFLYARGWCARWLAEAPEPGRPFDAFVSFAPEDERFVCEQLLPRLRGLAVQVGERDWEAGAAIPAQLRRSVAQARRTVAVVSRGYLAAPWARETLRAAHAAAAAERRVRTLAILTDVARADLDEDAAAHLALAAVVHARERRCWDKVLFALPRGRRPRAALAARALVNGGYAKDAPDELDAQLR